MRAVTLREKFQSYNNLHIISYTIMLQIMFNNFQLAISTWIIFTSYNYY